MKVFTKKSANNKMNIGIRHKWSVGVSIFFSVMIIFASLPGLSQTSVQNFGTGTGSHTSATGSTAFLPAPTSGTTWARGGAVVPNAPINLVTASNPLGTTGSYVRAVASSSTSVAKFSPWVAYAGSTEFYSSFKILFGDAAAGNTATSGTWSFYQGAGAMYSDANNFAGAQVFTGLQFVFGAGGAIAFTYRGGGAFINTGLTTSTLSSGTVYTFEIVGNNKTTGTIGYSYNGVGQTVAVQKFDLYLNGVKIGDDLAEALLPAGTSIASGTFIGVSSTGNVANVFVDNAVVYNAVPATIGASAPTVTTDATPISIASTSAELGGVAVNDGGNAIIDRGIVWSQTSVNSVPGIGGTGVTNVLDNGVPGPGTIIVSASSLPVNTQISYRAYATNGIGTTYGGAIGTTFYTLANVPNNVVVTNPTSATLDVQILSGDGNPSVTQYAIQETTSGNYVQSDGSLAASIVWQTDASWSTTTVTGLAPSTLYSFSAKARNVSGIETPFTPPTDGTTLASGQATLTASPVGDFGSVCVNTEAGPNTFTLSGTNLDTTQIILASGQGLSLSTDDITYYPQLAIIQPGGTFSQLIYAKLTPPNVGQHNILMSVGGGGATPISVPLTVTGVNTPPSLTTGGSSGVTQVAATLAGTIDADGCSAVTSYGIEYSLNNGFGNGTGTPVTSNNLNLGSYTVSTSTLNPNTTYYYKAYATNSGGTGYGLQQSFVTLGLDAPAAIAATNITGTSFTANWNAVTGADSYRLDVSTSPTFATTNATDLFISEYVEGSSNNKYVEIYNGTGASINLADYKLQLYTNGSPTAGQDITLSGTLANGATMVYKNASALIYGGASTTNAAVNYNGDDAVALFKISSNSYVDIFGSIGFDPGTAWTGAGGYSTLDKTLVRNANVGGGLTTNPGTSFPTLTTEWTLFAIDDVTHLGSHTFSASNPSFVPGYNNLTVNGLSQSVTGLTPNTTYYYRVRAFSANSISSNSNIISVVTCAPVITATAGANGSITPSGATNVACGGSQSYNITPAACYSIADVLVDGISQGAISNYNFTNVTIDHTISATFVINPALVTPAPLTGPINVCPYVGTGQQITYSVPQQLGATYAWVIPPTNVNLVSGQGTNSIVVTFQNGFIAQGNKQLRVTAQSPCGNSSQAVFILVAQLAATPGPITASSNNVCAVIGTAGTITYTIRKIQSASSYIWTAQAGTTFITHPNGPGPNDTTVNVSFTNGFTTSNITVQAVNPCGASGTRSITVTRSNPAVGPITGPTNACPYIQPDGTFAIYSVSPVATGISYNWTAPAGSIVTHPNGSGPNDYTIMVGYPNGFTSGSISVSVTNGCGTSAVRTLAISRLLPSAPGPIDVMQTAPCPNRIYTYSLPAMPANTTYILWTVPAGGTIISGQGTTSITVSYSGSVNGNVTAQGMSNCGMSAIRSVAVNLPACRAPMPPEFGKSGVPDHGTAEGMSVNIFPNPTVSDFKLQVITADKAVINIKVTDLQGRVLKTLVVMPYQTISVGSELSAGAYIIEVRQGKDLKTTRVLKF